MKTALRTAQPPPPPPAPTYPMGLPAAWNSFRTRSTSPWTLQSFPSAANVLLPREEAAQLSQPGVGLPGAPTPHLGDGRAAALTPQLPRRAGHVREHFSGNHIRYFFCFFEPSEGGGGREVRRGGRSPGKPEPAGAQAAGWALSPQRSAS